MVHKYRKDEFAGVYELVSKTTQEVYIGSSMHVLDRWKCHKWMLRKGKHNNFKLQRIVNKYGIDDLELIILDKEVTLDTIRDIEQKYLDELNPGLNIMKKAVLSYLDIEKLKTKDICAVRKENALKHWADPVKAAIHREGLKRNKGNKYAAGKLVVQEQIWNRRRAARISNMKRNYGLVWQTEYQSRYGVHPDEHVAFARVRGKEVADGSA